MREIKSAGRMAPNSLMMTGTPLASDHSRTSANRWRTTSRCEAVPHVPCANPAKDHGSYEWKYPMM